MKYATYGLVASASSLLHAGPCSSSSTGGTPKYANASNLQSETMPGQEEWH